MWLVVEVAAMAHALFVSQLLEIHRMFDEFRRRACGATNRHTLKSISAHCRPKQLENYNELIDEYNLS